MSGTGPPTNIVLIEDDPDIARLVERILTEAARPVEVRSELGDAPASGDVRLVITDLVTLRSYEEDAARDLLARVRERFPAPRSSSRPRTPPPRRTAPGSSGSMPSS